MSSPKYTCHGQTTPVITKLHMSSPMRLVEQFDWVRLKEGMTPPNKVGVLLSRRRFMSALCGFFTRRRLLVSYLYDLLLILVLTLPYFLIFTIPPFERIVWRDDRSIMFPHVESEIIPHWAVPIFALIIPLILITGWLGIRQFRNRKLLVVYLGLLLSLLITVQLTTLIKPMVGRPRPDFLARCDPDPSILSKVVCRGPIKLVHEGRRSFPSGHTSASFGGLGYAGFFLAGQLGVFDGEGHVYKLVVSMLPFLLAGCVGLTRIIDYRHHWQDVLAGAIIGTIAAYSSYRMYFPPITNQQSGSPTEQRFNRYLDISQSSPDKIDSPEDQGEASGANIV
ncbi:hypothetical protein PSACC_03397 [Paramicrosporidium saccamoebae]|uniref:Phosphatidic acid phosphatase type 2/haloperoxidase domain-containing protein n=1 Tax=Paramicrosporidium saccamoebae TaxID=1246581 RepID=A0A2H9TGF9_9FUNG|nr:hypothetical protein PSACC_03397 [Paramicrosporidium saccamoebae]